MKSEEPAEIDRILDRELLSYSKREPPPGLEDRVLQFVYSGRAGYAGRAKSWFGFPVWAVVAAVAALALILAPAVWIYSHRIATLPEQKALTKSKPLQPDRLPLELGRPLIARRGSNPSRAQKAARKGPGANELPKQMQFPAPFPITGEERALLVLARSAPDEALRISRDQAQPDVAPIEVKEIDIRPLRIDGLQQGAGE